MLGQEDKVRGLAPSNPDKGLRALSLELFSLKWGRVEVC